MKEIEIRELTPSRRADYLAFFDHDAFADNPRWASCYCFFNHAPHESEDWTKRNAAQNRAAVTALIDSGRMHGYLAYAEGRMIGWCNANLRSSYTTLDDDAEGAESVGSIVCFIVAQPYRGRGVASRLLEAACEGLRARGVAVVEAYPRREAAGEAANYHGPLSMYLDAGFGPVAEEDGIITVRKRLHPVVA